MDAQINGTEANSGVLNINWDLGAVNLYGNISNLDKAIHSQLITSDHTFKFILTDIGKTKYQFKTVEYYPDGKNGGDAGWYDNLTYRSEDYPGYVTLNGSFYICARKKGNLELTTEEIAEIKTILTVIDLDAVTIENNDCIVTDIENLQNSINNINSICPQPYDSTKIYNSTDYCIYNNKIYKCRFDEIGPESFTSGHWLLFTESFINEIYNNKANISNMSFIIPQTVPSFINYAHRGDRVDAPQNSLPAFAMAKFKGYNAIELDIRFTSDYIPVVIHNNSINDIAWNLDGSELEETVYVANLTYDELYNNYDFGIGFNSKYTGLHIATLEETLRLAVQLDLYVSIELKTSAGYRYIFFSKLLEAINNSGISYKKILISSFYKDYIQQFIDYIGIKECGFMITFGAKSLDQDNYGYTGYQLLEWLQSIKTNQNQVWFAMNYGRITEAIAKEIVIDYKIPLCAFTLTDISQFINLSNYVTAICSEQVFNSDVQTAIINRYIK